LTIKPRDSLSTDLEARLLRVDFSYIERHQRVWAKETYPYAHDVEDQSSNFQATGAASYYPVPPPPGQPEKYLGPIPIYPPDPEMLQAFKKVLQTHDDLIGLVQCMGKNAAATQLDVAKGLAEVLVLFTTAQEFQVKLLQTGGVPSLDVAPTTIVPADDAVTPLGAAGSPPAPGFMPALQPGAGLAGTQNQLNHMYDTFINIQARAKSGLPVPQGGSTGIGSSLLEELERVVLDLVFQGLTVIQRVGRVEEDFPPRAESDGKAWLRVRFDAQMLQDRYDRLTQDDSDTGRIQASREPTTAQNVILDRQPGMSGSGIAAPPWSGPAGGSYRTGIKLQSGAAAYLQKLADDGRNLMYGTALSYRGYLPAAIGLAGAILGAANAGFDALVSIDPTNFNVRAYVANLIRTIGIQSVQLKSASYGVEQARASFLSTVETQTGNVQNDTAEAKRYLKTRTERECWPNPTSRKGYPHVIYDSAGKGMVYTTPEYTNMEIDKRTGRWHKIHQ
jgi:hypothetical protein